MTTTEKQPRRLVIVESPTKARTIVGYLGEGYDVEASVGHIRDLPTPSELPADMKKGPYGKFAVDVDNDFDPYYRVDPGKKKKVTELKRLLKDADELYLATDEDREGEAIAWHLLEVLKPKIPVKRMVFHEITPEAIERALENTREIDTALVDAQETRRILDRLYGYEISPVLWRKIRAGLSAGRVQSVATRLVVERERERMAFVSADYWDLDVDLGLPDGTSPFAANLATLDGARVASGRDFNDKGELKNSSATVVDQARAEALATELNGTAKDALTVTAVESKPYSRKPAAPFTTSTLQQEAGRKLRMSARQAMRTAQSLYEHGYITYMRTDSSALSGQAISAARKQVTELYGPEFVPQSPRTYSGKQKSAQEAHEAIRPSGDSFRTPAQVSKSLSGDEFRLYDLIWKRTVASQMADAKGKTATIKVRADLADGHEAGFSASGTVITFRGFLAAYEEGTDAGRYDTKSGESRLPQVDEGRRCRWSRPKPTVTRQPHHRASRKPAWSSSSKSSASAVLRPTLPRSPSSRTAATSPPAATPWCPAGWRSPSCDSSRSTSPVSSTTPSPPIWNPNLTGSPWAKKIARPGWPASTSATSLKIAMGSRKSSMTSATSMPARSTPFASVKA